MLKVRIYTMNEGCKSQYFGLITTEGNVLHYQPTWKTRAGAIRWATKHGYKVVD